MNNKINNTKKGLGDDFDANNIASPVKNTSAVDKTIDRNEVMNARDSKKMAAKSDASDIVTIVDFLEKFLDRKGKILAEDKKSFDLLKRNLNSENKQRLVNQFLEKDKDLKYCLTLSEFLLEGSRSSSARLELLGFIEGVLSSYSYFSNIKTDTLLQGWLAACEGTVNKLRFFENQFRLTKGRDGKDKEKTFTEGQIGTLLCISAVWLYFKKESDFNSLTRYLSQTAFSTEGQSTALIEAQAFAYATSMISSTKKKGFAYFLQKVNETERKLDEQLKLQTDKLNFKSTEVLSLNKQIEALKDERDTLANEKQIAVDREAKLDAEVTHQQEKARHRNTHHEDSKDELRIKLKNILDGELKEVLGKARKAHTKGKHDVVAYQINDALDILQRELKRVDSND
ncbi:MAG: hypothetical protein JKY50_18580 [Oleispira sp.]|nr:hypothetical protein [Oleispira sp.]